MLRLTFQSGARRGETVEPSGLRYIVGRDTGCDLVLEDPKVSRHHAAFSVAPNGRLVLGDLGSSNGTFVNGARLRAPRELSGGERVRIGETVLQVLGPGDPDALGLAPSPKEPAGLRARLARVLRGRGALTLLAIGAIVGVGAALLDVLAGDDAPRAAARGAAAAVAPATVLVRASVDGRRTRQGSGWLLDARQGLVVTNAHIFNLEPVAGAVGLAVEVGGRTLRARPLSVAPCEDLAILRLEESVSRPSLRLGRQSTLARGDAVVSAGFPVAGRGAENVATIQGTVLDPHIHTPGPLGPGVLALDNVIRIDAALRPGSSGGPVVDLSGRLVGVTTLTAPEEGERRAYAIGVDRLRTVLPRLARGDSLAWTGATFAVARSRGGDRPAGLFLTAAAPRTAARRAGLGRRPWLLEAVDGRRVGSTVAGYCRAASRAGSGDRLRLRVRPARALPGRSFSVESPATRRVVEVGFE